jgi:hypothetical protein
MEKTYQFQNINMLEHGKMVFKSYQEILNNSETLISWIGQDLFDLLVGNQYPLLIMEVYQIYHDCGKPYCRTFDESGRQHFPNHAQISGDIYQQYFDCPEAHKLILNDMQFHTLKGEELIQWIKKEEKIFICSLYLTAWSEIIANSSMFGGFDSTSFKIKKKQLITAGKKLMHYYQA